MKLQILAVVLGAFLGMAPALANAQATRTWVSGVGDDANPCSRTAPCKTWAGAISKTAAGGEMDALDPGGFGGVTITKAITLDGQGELSSILVAGTPGITIYAGATDKVVIKNMTINGVVQSSIPGTQGINFVAGGALSIENTTIQNFANYCVNFQPSVRANLVITDSILENCTQGGVISSASSGGVNRLNLKNVHIVRSGPAVSIGANSNAVIVNSFIDNNPGGGVTATASTAVAMLTDSSISNNQVFGVYATGGSTIRLALDTVTANAGAGLQVDGGSVLQTFSNNWVAGNNPDGAPSTTTTGK